MRSRPITVFEKDQKPSHLINELDLLLVSSNLASSNVGESKLAPQALSRKRLDDEKSMAALERKAAEAAGLLKLLANENRLLILCRLTLAGELSVNDLADGVGLSQSAISQHLAKMREEGLLATRREAQTVFYRTVDPNAARLLALLKDIYCP
jgi:DNA-binding transcriptional ArsR family regulator